MSDIVHSTKSTVSHALIDNAKYEKWYKESIENPDAFWAEHCKRIDWSKPFTRVKNTSFNGDVSIKWFEDGETNVSYNCIDRHLKDHGHQVAIIWEGDNPYIDKKITYNELYEHVCRLAHVMKARGVKKGPHDIKGQGIYCYVTLMAGVEGTDEEDDHGLRLRLSCRMHHGIDARPILRGAALRRNADWC